MNVEISLYLLRNHSQALLLAVGSTIKPLTPFFALMGLTLQLEQTV